MHAAEQSDSIARFHEGLNTKIFRPADRVGPLMSMELRRNTARSTVLQAMPPEDLWRPVSPREIEAYQKQLLVYGSVFAVLTRGDAQGIPLFRIRPSGVARLPPRKVEFGYDSDFPVVVALIAQL